MYDLNKIVLNERQIIELSMYCECEVFSEEELFTFYTKTEMYRTTVRMIWML